ncbi:amino acid/amide ABC transporter membrane protein 2 (HAAT family) [Tamaricihabitans halophyticus]|uniref:Amino acid/amide ABC transporter membrane protein 2 (HAAT family) n=1 Tax=Tamaricihabitans halophyticus TaxID=1262583 RepID=A0A4R2QFM7_9PSEU|nr:branched-chain amino acid ABC transporter permease [Tamaricihabitans halophyticus]TCP47867.1 amino acid/amide ABC transporter membrane protein 2 (HAAT family) [Tamaricihabitans halophyticus]
MRNDSSRTVVASSAAGWPRARVAKLTGLLALVVFVVAFPRMAADPFILSVGVIIMSYAVLATSWNFVGGFTGYISLGHASYSGLGGYATVLLILHTGVNPWLAMFLGGVIVALLAIPIGIASLRVRGASFVIVSIALVLILLLVFQSWGSFTGGSNGLRVPRPFGDEVLRPEQHERFFYLHAVLLAIAVLCWWLIDRSRFGTGLKAIREDEDKAQSLGVPTFAYKLVVFVISAFFTALGGGMYALWFGFLDPIFQFSILTGSYMVLMSLLGGIRNVFGPILGAVIVGYAMEFFKAQYGDTQIHLVALGVLLGIVVLFMPDGILPALRGLVIRFRPQATSIREVTQEELTRDATGSREESATDRGTGTKEEVSG